MRVVGSILLVLVGHWLELRGGQGTRMLMLMSKGTGTLILMGEGGCDVNRLGGGGDIRVRRENG